MHIVGFGIDNKDRLNYCPNEEQYSLIEMLVRLLWVLGYGHNFHFHGDTFRTFFNIATPLEYEGYESPRSKENPHWCFILSLASLGGICNTKRLSLGWVSLYK